MFCSDDAVNRLFRYSKTLVDDIATKKEKPNDFILEQYLIFAGMVSYYGFEYIDIIYKVFHQVGFIDDNRDIKEILGEEYLQNGYTPSFCDVNISSVDNKYVIQRNIYHLNYSNEAYRYFIEELVHEVNHCINSTVYPICKRNLLPVYRNGVSIAAINGGYREASCLEEGFNTLQSAEIMNHILDFAQYNIEDSSIRGALDRLTDRRKNPFGLGYETITRAIYPLYTHPDFYSLLKNGRISGDLKSIRNDFDQRVGNGSFFELATSIDSVWNDQDLEHTGKVYQLVSKYINR